MIRLAKLVLASDVWNATVHLREHPGMDHGQVLHLALRALSKRTVGLVGSTLMDGPGAAGKNGALAEIAIPKHFSKGEIQDFFKNLALSTRLYPKIDTAVSQDGIIDLINQLGDTVHWDLVAEAVETRQSQLVKGAASNYDSAVPPTYTQNYDWEMRSTIRAGAHKVSVLADLRKRKMPRV